MGLRRRQRPEPYAGLLVAAVIQLNREVNRHGLRSKNVEDAYEELVYELCRYLAQRDEPQSKRERLTSE